MSESEAPGKKDPVPTTMPVAPPGRIPPTAGDESTTWLVSARQIWFPLPAQDPQMAPVGVRLALALPRASGPRRR